MNRDRSFEGQDVKYLVQIDTPGFDMATDDFFIRVRHGQKEKTFQKADLIDEVSIVDGVTQHNYYLAFNTGYFGPGELTCIITAYAPDTDFEDGIRTEIDKFTFSNVESL